MFSANTAGVTHPCQLLVLDETKQFHVTKARLKVRMAKTTSNLYGFISI